MNLAKSGHQNVRFTPESGHKEIQTELNHHGHLLGVIGTSLTSQCHQQSEKLRPCN